MKSLFIILFVLPPVVFSNDFPGEFTGEVSVEYRYFPDDGAYGNSKNQHSSVAIKPEYSLSWDNDRNVLSVVPFFRLDRQDSQRKHIDVREFSLVSSWSSIELRLGISKVFWGVTESRHLVDVINQTDLVENPDSEQKLGQPMINPVLVTSTGNFELYILPYFRERTYSGESGRYRGASIIDSDNAEYIHPDKEQHIDYALRWSTNWQDLEWAISFFRGTDRDPAFRPDSLSNTLMPVYGQSKQAGLEMQYIYKDLLIKAELLRKDSFNFGLYTAATSGFEYTLTNVSNGMDIGFLYEWLYDNRNKIAPSGMYDASFVATRIAFNNSHSTEILAGMIFDNTSSNLNMFRVEASHRLMQSVSLNAEINVIDQPPANSMLYQFRTDDYMQITLTSFF